MQLLDKLPPAAGIRRFETRDSVGIIGLFAAGNGPGHFISQEPPQTMVTRRKGLLALKNEILYMWSHPWFVVGMR